MKMPRNLEEEMFLELEKGRRKSGESEMESDIVRTRDFAAFRSLSLEVRS